MRHIVPRHSAKRCQGNPIKVASRKGYKDLAILGALWAKGRHPGVDICLMLSLFFFASDATGFSEEFPFSYTVTASVATDVPSLKSRGALAVFSRREDTVTFAYSNGNWTLDYSYGFPTNVAVPTNMVASFHCRSIPDGIRYYFIPRDGLESGTAQAVMAIPESYPPPEQQWVLLSWLSLCPNPKLPLIGPKQIRRFIASQYQENTNNIGTFTSGYLSPKSAFLDHLIIGNVGTDLAPDGGLVKLPSPFNRGYVEFEYQLLEKTNFNGVDFPLHSSLKEFMPKANGKSLQDVDTYLSSELKVLHLQAGSFSAPSPPLMVAFDGRPKQLSAGVTADYYIADDEWASKTNKKLERLAVMMSRSYESNKPASYSNQAKRRIFIALLLIITASIPLVAILNHKRKRKEPANPI